MISFRRPYLFHGLIGVCIAALAGGCALFGLAAYAAPDPTVGPKYKGLQNQTTAVMVWADRATAIDWPGLQLDLTRGIQSRLQNAAQKKDPLKEMKGAKFAAAESAVRYQRDHPEIDTEAITDVAPRLNVTRLVYLEVQQFSTQPDDSLELYRGTLSGNLKVIEIHDGVAKVAFEEDNIHVAYPKNTPPEGMPGLANTQVYEQTLEAFSTQIVNRFITHTEPRE
jgi:hypothetical protein